MTPATRTQLNWSQHEVFTHSVPSALTILSSALSLYGRLLGWFHPRPDFVMVAFSAHPIYKSPFPWRSRRGCHFNLFIAFVRVFSVSNMSFLVCFTISYLYSSSDLILLEEGSRLIPFSPVHHPQEQAWLPGGSL